MLPKRKIKDMNPLPLFCLPVLASLFQKTVQVSDGQSEEVYDKQVGPGTSLNSTTQGTHWACEKLVQGAPENSSGFPKPAEMSRDDIIINILLLLLFLSCSSCLPLTMPGIDLCSLQLFSLLLTTTLRGKYYKDPIFSDGETEVSEVRPFA